MLLSWWLGEGDRLIDVPLVLLAAVVVEAYVGELRWLFHVLPHPARAAERAARWAEVRLNRAGRSDGALRLRGWLAGLALAALAALLGVAIDRLAAGRDLGLLIELLLLVTLIRQRGLWDRLGEVQRALAEDLETARRALAGLAPDRLGLGDYGRLDSHGVARGAIEAAADRFPVGAVAPALWYLAFGAAGLLLQLAVGRFADVAATPAPRHAAFGAGPRRLARAVEAPARWLAGGLVVVASLFVSGARPGGALGLARWHGLEPTAMAAGALDLALGGPRRYAERVVERPWIGGGRARATAQDVARTRVLFAVSGLLLAGLAAAAAIAALRFG